MIDLLTHAIGLVAGGGVGFLSTLLGPVMNYFAAKQKLEQSKIDNAQQLAVMGLQLESQKLQGAQQLAEIKETGVQAVQLEDAKAEEARVEQDATPVGVWWVDALRFSVRPVIAYWVFGLYCLVKTATLIAAWPNLSAAWGPEDTAMLAMILAHYFGDRHMTRMLGAEG